jgi:tRNA-modifying protein YgfZ
MDETSDLDQLSTGAVLFDPSKELVIATGADRVRFLHGIVTGDVAGTPVGAGCHAALLTPKAHVIAEMRIFVREKDLHLVVTAGQGALTAAALSRYAIMDDFVAAPQMEVAFIALLGPMAGVRLGEAGYAPGELASRPLWSHADAIGTAGLLWLGRVRQLGTEGYWVSGPTSAISRLAQALAVPRLAPAAAEAARVAAGEPAWGQEITADYFPMEVGLDGAVDYTKGCFLGQEPIVRIRDRGHINWRLARLELDDAADSEPDVGPDSGRVVRAGDRLQTEAKPKAGRVTSVARLADGRGVALGLVHVSVPAGDRVRIVSIDGDVVGSARVIAQAVGD